GPLRNRHGSQAPASSVLSADEQTAVRASTPGAALDSAAKLFGASTGFDKMANDPNFYNPQAEGWWGKCHAWSWSSLSAKIDKMVDIDGPEGQKGIWIGGQWMSRADLGDWMMGVADTVALSDPSQFKSNLTAA